jgi:hypothetical protein
VHALTLLRQDHVEVLAMMDELESRRPGAVGAENLAERKALVTDLVMAESRHEAVEETHFWPAVRKALPDGDELADHAIEQETKAKQVLDRLDRLDADDPEFEDLLARLLVDGRAHIRYEQEEVWPKLDAALDAAAMHELGEKMAEAKKTAPTRPHPHTPPNEGVLKTAGPAVAAVDRMRDAATGRGKQQP